MKVISVSARQDLPRSPDEDAATPTQRDALSQSKEASVAKRTTARPVRFGGQAPGALCSFPRADGCEILPRPEAQGRPSPGPRLLFFAHEEAATARQGTGGCPRAPLAAAGLAGDRLTVGRGAAWPDRRACCGLLASRFSCYYLPATRLVQ
jgi:hypothetical protein